MTTSTLTLADFLLARIAEDEAAAEYWFLADVRNWSASGADVRWHDGFIVRDVADYVAAHIARHDPARVLKKCKADREVVQIATDQIRLGREARDWDNWEDMANQTLRALALPYADHPEFREEWKA